jgi:hypothetical protein
MPAADKTVLVVYTAIDYTLTINYEYGDGSEAATSYVDAAMNVGDPYSVLSPVIAGYTADQLTVSGNMPAADKTVLVVYTCDPCSGWSASNVTVIFYYAAGSSGHSDPRIDVDGEITGPACAGITEIDVVFELYNHGGIIKESYSTTVTSANNSFGVNLDINPASYNAGDTFKLWITVEGCGDIMVLEGIIVETDPPV